MPHRNEDLRDAAALLSSPHPCRSARRRGHPSGPLNAVIVEAVCRDLLQQLAADRPHPWRYYLALQGGDPQAALLRRVRALAPGVQPRSQCRVSARSGVVDHATGDPGVILEVSQVSWRHATAAEILAGYFATPWHAAAFRYRVAYTGVRWSITAARELWRVHPCGELPNRSHGSRQGYRWRTTDDSWASRS
jgi:hypothetical protein